MMRIKNASKTHRKHIKKMKRNVKVSIIIGILVGGVVVQDLIFAMINAKSDALNYLAPAVFALYVLLSITGASKILNQTKTNETN